MSQIDVEDPKLYPLGSIGAEVTVIAQEPKVVLTGMWGWISKNLGIPGWGQLLLLILTPVVLAFSITLLHIEVKLASIDTKVDSIPLQIGKDLVSRAKFLTQKGKTGQAVSITNAAASLISEAAAQRLKASPRSFQTIVDELNALEGISKSSELTESITQARFELADYRSAIEPPHKLEGKRADLSSTYIVGNAQTVNPSNLPGTIFVSAMPPGLDFLATTFIRSLQNGPIVENIAFKGGEQTLDGFHWINVAFINTRVKYQGGEVELKNVRFINCTFDITPNDRGAQFANYAALASPSLVIKSNV